jgi:hypothetical protein
VSFKLVVALVVAGILFTDYEFGNGRLIDSGSAHAVRLGYAMSNYLSAMARRVSP